MHWLERNSTLFRNEHIGRALPPQAIDAVLGAVVARGDGEWDATRARVLVYWRKPADWGALIWGWIESTGQNGAVLTVHEIRHGSSAQGQPFYGLDLDAMLRALQALETDGKCALMDGDQGDGLVRISSRYLSLLEVVEISLTFFCFLLYRVLSLLTNELGVEKQGKVKRKVIQVSMTSSGYLSLHSSYAVQPLWCTWGQVVQTYFFDFVHLPYHQPT